MQRINPGGKTEAKAGRKPGAGGAAAAAKRAGSKSPDRDRAKTPTSPAGTAAALGDDGKRKPAKKCALCVALLPRYDSVV